MVRNTMPFNKWSNCLRRFNIFILGIAEHDHHVGVTPRFKPRRPISGKQPEAATHFGTLIGCSFRIKHMKIPRILALLSAVSILPAGAAFLGGILMVTASGWSAANAEKIESSTKKDQLRELSVKCDLPAIPEISTKRLSGCGSATLLQDGDEDLRRSTVLFRINPTDAKISDGNRAELRHLHEAVNGEEIWYRISTKLPVGFPIENKHRLVLSQWHERTNEGERSLRPPLSHRLWDGRFVVTLWNQDRIDRLGIEGDGEILFEIPKFEIGVYYDFVYKFVWSPGKDGQIVGWMRKCETEQATCENAPWEKIIQYQGPNGYDDIVGYYFKYGLYTVSEFDTTFTAYHRDYRAGPSAQEIGLTDPEFQ